MGDFKNQAIGNKYDILKKIAQGGQGSVYLARDKRSKKKCALKVFKIDKEDEGNDKGNVRVQREVEITRTLKHDNIVETYDDHQFFFDGEMESYITMEYVDGPDFMDYLNNGYDTRYASMLLGKYIHIIHNVSSALTYAHGKGILHRDIKPRNILLQIKDGSHIAKLSDFGMAKRSVDYAHTRLGEAPGGSTHYKGIEYYLRDKNTKKFIYPVDERSDVYALGVTMYNALTRRSPIQLEGLGAEPHAMAIEHEYANQLGPYIKKNRYHTSPSSINSGIPEDVSDVCIKATALFPKDRYQTMAEFQQALKKLSEKYPEKERVLFDDVKTHSFVFSRDSTLTEVNRSGDRHVGKEVASFSMYGSKNRYILTPDNKLAFVHSGGLEIHDIDTKEKITIEHKLKGIDINEILPVYFQDKNNPLYLVNAVHPNYSSFFVFDSKEKAMSNCLYTKAETSKDQHLFYHDDLICILRKGCIAHFSITKGTTVQKKVADVPHFYDKIGDEIVMGIKKEDTFPFAIMDQNTISPKKKIGKIASKVEHFVFNHYDQRMYVVSKENILTPYEIVREQVIGRKTTCKQFESLRLSHKVDALYTTLKYIVCKENDVYHLYRGSSNGEITPVGKFAPNKKEYDEIKMFPQSPYVAVRKKGTVKIYRLDK